MKPKEFLRRLRRAGVEVDTKRGKGGHYLVRYQGRQTTVKDLQATWDGPEGGTVSPITTRNRSGETMVQIYPVILTRDESGSVIVEFPDVPEALTCGADEENAIQWAQDALVVALSGYVDDRRDIPQPSRPNKGQQTVSLPPLVATKLAIHQAMRAQHVTQAALADRLHCDARQVRRLLDLDHQSRIDQIEAALGALGKQLVVDIRDAA